jgi:hypothetical protein
MIDIVLGRLPMSIYEITSKPLGITGDVGEYLAAKFLGLQLADARALATMIRMARAAEVRSRRGALVQSLGR